MWVLHSLGGHPMRPSRIPVRRKGASTFDSTTALFQAGDQSHGEHQTLQPPPGMAQHSPGTGAAVLLTLAGPGTGHGLASLLTPVSVPTGLCQEPPRGVQSTERLFLCQGKGLHPQVWPWWWEAAEGLQLCSTICLGRASGIGERGLQPLCLGPYVCSPSLPCCPLLQHPPAQAPGPASLSSYRQLLSFCAEA